MTNTALKKFILRGILFGFMIAMSFPRTAYAVEVLKIGGVGSALGSMKMLGNAFEKKNPGVKVDVLPSLGSSGAVKAVSKGAIDIGLSGRQMNEEEMSLGLSVIEYAKTPLVFVVRNEVNISGITHDEIVKIYKSETLKWPDGKRIRLVLRLPHESDVLVIKKISPQISEAVDSASAREGMLVAVTEQNNADMIEDISGSFGTAVLTLLISEKRKLKMLAYNGVMPCIENLANGTYPIYKSLFMITRREPSKLAGEFLSFVRSAEGKKILEKTGNLAVIDKNQ